MNQSFWASPESAASIVAGRKDFVVQYSTRTIAAVIFVVAVASSLGGIAGPRWFALTLATGALGLLLPVAWRWAFHSRDAWPSGIAGVLCTVVCALAVPAIAVLIIWAVGHQGQFFWFVPLIVGP